MIKSKAMMIQPISSMQHNPVLNAQNWAVKQRTYANCEEILAKAIFYLKVCCKFVVKAIMRFQREDAAVILLK